MKSQIVSVVAILAASICQGEILRNIPGTSEVPEQADVQSGIDNIVIYGDSNTEGSSDPTHVPNVLYADYLAKFFPYASVTNTGISGWKIADVLATLPNYDSIPTTNTYDVATILIGINDISAGTPIPTIRSAFSNLIFEVVAQGWDKVVVVNYYAWDVYASGVRSMNQGTFRACAEYSNVVYIDLDSLTVDPTDGKLHQDFYWGDGNQHINQAGHFLVGDQIKGAMASGVSLSPAPPFKEVSRYSEVLDFGADQANLIDHVSGTTTALANSVPYYDARLREAAININTNDCFISMPAAAQIQIADSFTAYGWFKTGDSTAAFMRLFFPNESAGLDAYNLTIRPSSDVLQLYIRSDEETNIEFLHNWDYSGDGEWHLFWFTFDRVNDAVTLGIDLLFTETQPSGFGDITAMDLSAIAEIYMGGEDTGLNGFDGQMTNMRMVKRIMPWEELYRIYMNGIY